MKRFLFSSAICFGVLTNAQGQSLPKFQTVVPVSPTASTLQKFSDYPVDLHTGLVDISIPIYTIDINGIKVPIEFKYHAAGIKYDDNCQGLGIGWTLMAGGMISGTVQGIADYPAGNNYFKNAGAINPKPNCDNAIGNDPNGENLVLMNFDRGTQDSEYDQFNFSYPGGSGKFFYPGTSTPVITPYQHLTITRSGTYGINTPFDITDQNGITYKFGHYTDANKQPAIESSFTDQRTANSLLTEIISADKADVVTFNYHIIQGDPSQVGTQSKLVINDQVEVRDQLSWGYGGFMSGGQTLDPTHETLASNFLENFTFAQLTDITFRTGKIVFTYDGTSQRMTGVYVYNNKQTAPVKAITVQQSTFGSDFYKLDQVNFYDSVLQQNYNYKMSYTGTPYNKWHTGIDYWGFHNGVGYTTDYIPNFQVSTSTVQGGTLITDNVTVGGMDRTANESAMLQGMLNKITYPTGGSSVFTLEANRYSGGQIAGGLRIKKIDNYDLNGAYVNSKWYKYGQTENGDGSIYKAITPADYCYNVWDIYTEGVYTYPNGSSSDGVPAYVYNERSYGAFPKFSNTWNGSPVVYDYVTEYTGDGTNANGKTVYNFENIADVITTSNFYSSMSMVAYSNSWKTGKLLSKLVYSKSGTTYNQIYSLVNQYQDFNFQNYHCLKVIPSINWHDQGMSVNDRLNALDCFKSNPCIIRAASLGSSPITSVHAYADYYLPTGSRELISSVETKDGVSVTSQYTYDATYLKPAQMTVTKSNGDTRLITYTYPFSLATTPYTQMVSKNIVNPVVTTSEYNGDLSHFLQSSTVNYANWTTNLFAPSSIDTKAGSNAQESRLIFDGYDSYGNITQRHKAGGSNEVYLYGYNNAYPIAEAINAKKNNVFFESFEEGAGNSALEDDKTGHYSHTGLYSKTVSGLDAGNYILRYWQKPTGGAWTLVTTTLAVSGTSYTISLNAQIDDVCFYPSGAQMTTYTYDPLIGMTSMTDPKGLVTCYEYDNFQRLKNVKNNDGNIVKHIEYHYQGQ